jgi:hypothetical protein
MGSTKIVVLTSRGGEQPLVEVLLIESEIAMRCIRKGTLKGQFDNDRYY